MLTEQEFVLQSWVSISTVSDLYFSSLNNIFIGTTLDLHSPSTALGCDGSRA